MLSKIRESLPKNVKNVLFRAESGFFDGKIFDLWEQEDWLWNGFGKSKIEK
jgi:hypothetical protein